MPQQKSSKPRLEPHAENFCSCFCTKKARFKKALVCLAVAQIIGILYLYHQNRRSPSQKQEVSPSAATVEEIKWQNGVLYHLPLTQAKDMSKYYTEVKENVWCLTSGTKSNKHIKGKCDCLDGWMGLDCGIPPAVWNSEFIAKGSAKGVQIRRRHHPRRLIYSLVYNGELELLNYTLTYLGNVVEVFLIGDISSSRSYRTIADLAPNFMHKVVHMYLSSFRTESYVNIQKEIWLTGKGIMSDFRPDDVVILTDVVSVPSKDVLNFFKLYEGYSEPIQFKLATTDSLHNGSMNFTTKSTLVSADIMACTFEYLRYLCTYDASQVWSYDHVSRKEESQQFQKNNWPLRQWTVGSTNFPAGQVCVFCLPANIPASVAANITVISLGGLEYNATKINPTLEGNITNVA